MKWLLYGLFGLLLAVLVMAVAYQYPGYVRIVVAGYLVETTLWAASLVLVLLLGVALLVVKLPAGAYRFLVSHGRIRRARRHTTQGLLNYAEGNWRQAQKHLLAGAAHSETPLINYLAAAQAANEQGDSDESDLLLKKAYQSVAGADLAVGVTQAQLQMSRNQYEQALATLMRLKGQAPHHPLVLRLLKQTYVKLNDWRGLRDLLPDLKKRGLTSEDEQTELELRTWTELLNAAADDVKKRHKDETSLRQFHAVWDSLPGSMRKNEAMIYRYACWLNELGEGREAETLLRKVLNSHWGDSLVTLYGLISSADNAEQLICAERWLKERPNNAELLLALGRISLRNQLWGKAREYFETSLRLKKTGVAYAELCRLEAHFGRHAKSSEYFLNGLVGGVGLPPLPMPDAEGNASH